MGSTRLITNESGNVVTEIAYNPFGESAVTGEEDSYLYNGKEKDSSGLYYYGARYYDCEIGRFTSRDPNSPDFNNPQSLNRYTYCLNNPLKYIDPLGLEEEEKNIFEMSEEELREYIQSLLNDGISLGDLLTLLGECLKGLMDVFESLLDLEFSAIMTVLEPQLFSLAIIAEICNEHFDNFEG